MRVKRSVPRLATVLALTMVAMLTMRCESQQSPPVEEPQRGSEAFELLRLDRYPAPVKITINRPQQTIDARPPHVDICKTANFCPEDEFEWKIPGGLKEGERLVIRGARQVCFPWEELEIPYPNNGALSGPFIDDCEPDDKYGFYWPYVIELYEEGNPEPIAQTDPSGIFRR